MSEYGCQSCGYIYDPDRSDCNNIQFKDRPDNWECPACHAPKKNFEKMGSEYKAMKEKFSQNSRTT